MDAMVIGSLTGSTAVVGVLLWQLRARPDLVLGVHGETWSGHLAASILALRLAGAVLLFLLGFLTGLAVAFLSATSTG